MPTARFWALWVAAGAFGCGGVDSATEHDLSDSSLADEELARVTQGLGEATCGSTPGDAVLDPNVGQPVFSPDNSYDHPTCRNGFVIDVPGVRAGRQFTGGPSLVRWPDPITCLLHWGYLSLWQKQPSGTYAKVAENTRLGVWGPLPRIGYVCAARAGVQAPADGDYKLVSSGGILFGSYASVSVY